MNEINIKELPVKDIFGIWWGFFWRAIIITLGSMVVGGIAGALFGFIVGLTNAVTGGSQETIIGVSKMGGGVLGLLVGAYFFYIYLCWLLKSKLGKYRLVLLRADGA